jgi:hypothetical protein
MPYSPPTGLAAENDLEAGYYSETWRVPCSDRRGWDGMEQMGCLEIHRSRSLDMGVCWKLT